MYKIDFNGRSHIYFLGIGGISMSSLAELLHRTGFTVSGSDRKSSAITKALEEKGITVKYGESASHIPADVDCAILTSAIRDTNPEFLALQERRIPCLTRAQLLGQLMENYEISIGVSGTHGKTTTTSMISEILLRAGVDPTLSLGGILKSVGGNIRVGGRRYFVTEACEYTNSFLSLSPTVGLILNIEEDHMDFFKDLADIRNSFRRFAGLLPEDGCLIINAAIPDYQEITDGLSCRVVTFSCGNRAADYFSSDVAYDGFGHPSFLLHSPGSAPEPFSLRVPGLHNVANAVAAAALADYLSLDRSVTVAALRDYAGTDRRFEYKGSVGGVTIIDDYAHHPTEITATLDAAKNYPHKTLWCVFQPHTYSRTKEYLKEFARTLSQADRIVLADIFAARETDHLGVSSQTLQAEIRALGHECEYFPTFDEIENYLLKNCINGDLLITMGAGDVHKIGESLLGA